MMSKKKSVFLLLGGGGGGQKILNSAHTFPVPKVTSLDALIWNNKVSA